MRKYYIVFIGILILFASCNADILTQNVPTYSGETSSSNTRELFNGEAPKNIYASKSYYADRILITFDSVPGADYYEIYSAKLPRNILEYDFESVEWLKSDLNIEATGKAQETLTYTPDSEEKDDYYYLFTVRAASYFNGQRGIYEGEFSSVAEGWTLSPPTNVTVGQGEYTDRINVSWNTIDNIRGYNVYKLNSGSSEWERVNTSLIPSTFESMMIYSYYPADRELGTDLYFRVSAVSIGGVASEMSSVRNGYTYVEGAPKAPEKLVADKAESSSSIKVSWAKPTDDILRDGYTWEVYRNTSTSNQELICTFNALDYSKDPSKTPSVEIVGDKYVFTDISDFEPNIEYTYIVRAISKIEGDDGTLIDAIGPSRSTIGFIMAAPKNIAMKVNYPDGEFAGSFDITIKEPSIGYSSDKDWSYIFYGRSNNGTITSDWNAITARTVTDGELINTINYSEYPYNEFAITLRDNISNDETNINLSTILVVDSIKIDDISINSNRYNSLLTANENGVYPVWLSVANPEHFKSIDLRVTINGDTTEHTLNVKDLSSLAYSLGTDLSPSEPFVSYSYSFKGNSYFGRTTQWSSTAIAYGAVTGEKFIKLFEAYAMKPWEFVGYGDFPQNLKDKWINNDMHKAIDAHDTNSLGNYTVPSEYHGGNVNYSSSIGSGFTGNVVFTFTNFGELEGIYSNGSYTMSGVNMSGNNGKVSGTVTVGGMYPATVNFGNLSVTGYAFEGNYSLTQDNASGTVSVKATRNE